MAPPARREDPIDAQAEELYGLPLSRFTAERKRIADALRAQGERALALRGKRRRKRRRVRVPDARAADLPTTECSTRRGAVARCRREDGRSRARIRKVQSCAAETVGMGHHGRTTLVYAGDISWK